MSWSYSGDPTTRDLDAVRFHAGLTDENDPIIEDAEILYLLQSNGVLRASAKAARRAAHKLAREVDRAGSGVEAAESQQVDHFHEVADRLERELMASGGGAFVGGVSEDAADTLEDDSDRIPQRFERGQFDAT